MKALRLVLHQNKCNYRKENSVSSRMTYPLPPLSTIIGAIHNICNWEEYVPMDVSIQGKFESLGKEMHNLQVFTDSCMDDRYTLVKMCNPNMLYNHYIKVSKSLDSQNSRHSKEKLTHVFNRDLLEEYKQLRLNKESLNDKKKKLDTSLKDIRSQKKLIKDKNSEEFLKLLKDEKELNEKFNEIQDKIEKNNYEYSLYRTVTSSPTTFEILYNVDLIIYLKFEDENRLQEVQNNIYKLNWLGRSEDDISIIDSTIVDLNLPKDEINSYKDYISYINVEDIKNEDIYEKTVEASSLGTDYYLNKDYKIIDNKRIFNKKRTRLLSGYYTDENSKNVYVDSYNGENVIISFN